MERLDACYFCGTAADAPLNEVSISPRSRRDDPEATVRVTLCPSCETKLERILGGLFEHVESREADAEAAVDRVEPSADDPPDDEPESAATSPVDRIDVSPAGDGPASAPEGRRRLFTDPDDEGSAPTGTDGDPNPVADDDAEVLDDEPRARARATTAPEDGLDDVSVAEYNRVMRLLQNRAFPIGRAAFVDLAASAYDLGEDTVEAVLETLIDQGSLVEREGELDRPSEGGP